SANSRSNAATSGPCVTHPERIVRRAASASRSPIHGLATGIVPFSGTRLLLTHSHGRTNWQGPQGSLGLLLSPPRDQSLQALSNGDLRFETDLLLRSSDISQTPWYCIHFARRAILGLQI